MEKEFTVEPTGLYTIQQTANYLGVSRVTINNWCKRHDSTRLPYEINKMNGRKLFKGEHIMNIKRNKPAIPEKVSPIRLGGSRQRLLDFRRRMNNNVHSVGQIPKIN